jgi:hypothetical protein
MRSAKLRRSIAVAGRDEEENMVPDDIPRYRPLNYRGDHDDDPNAIRPGEPTTVEPAGQPVTLDWDCALVVARAVLFYIRHWDGSGPESDENVPTRALLEDGGTMAANAERCLPLNVLAAVNDKLDAEERR